MGISNSNSLHALDFFRIAEQALSNDLRSHLMKVFDRPKDTASFWKILEECYDESSIAIKKSGADIDRIKSISTGLKHIRDKTHFHIDRKAVCNPREIYNEAKVTYDDIDYLLDFGFKILSYIYQVKTGQERELPQYDGSDVPDIIRSYKKCFPNIPIIISS